MQGSPEKFLDVTDLMNYEMMEQGTIGRCCRVIIAIIGGASEPRTKHRGYLCYLEEGHIEAKFDDERQRGFGQVFCSGRDHRGMLCHI